MRKQFFSVVVVLMFLFSSCGTNKFDPPSNVVITVGASRIELKWSPVSAIIGYNIYRSTTSGPIGTKTAISTRITATTFVDSTAIPGTTYYYQVTSYNSTGDSSASPEISATIKATPPGTTLMGGTIQGVPLTEGYNVTTLAGTSLTGAADGARTAASFNHPIGITTDGTSLYVSDYSNHMIRRIDIATGTVSTLAGSSTPGSSNGVGASAGFTAPKGITTDGTYLYVADSGNKKIRKIEIATGTVTTVAGSGTSGNADGTGSGASFNIPEDLTTDGASLFVTDSGNNNIRKIDISTGAVTTVAGSTLPGLTDGTGTAARFNEPSGITTDGTNLYVADSKNNVIRMIVIATGVVTKVSGTGSPGQADGDTSSATFLQPKGITTDGANLFVTDFDYSLIREIF